MWWVVRDQWWWVIDVGQSRYGLCWHRFCFQCMRSFSPSKCWPSASVQFWSATIHTDQGTGVCAYAVHAPSIVLAPLRESLMQASPFLSNSAHHFAPISPWPSNRDHDAKDPGQYNLYSQLFCIQIMRAKNTTTDKHVDGTCTLRYAKHILTWYFPPLRYPTPAPYMLFAYMFATRWWYRQRRQVEVCGSLWEAAQLSWVGCVMPLVEMKRVLMSVWVKRIESRGSSLNCLELRTLKKCRSYAVIGQFVSC